MSDNAYYKKIDLIKSFLLNQTRFAFVRFGDGELGVIDGLDQKRLEWKWKSGDPRYDLLRQELIQSFQYIHPHYYIGIEPGIEAIIGSHKLQHFYKLCGQSKDYILTANLFVNQNYRIFRDELVPLFNQYKTVVVCQATRNIDSFPFSIVKHFSCHEDSWIHDNSMRHDLKRHATTRYGYLYLFMVGPFSNILVRELHQVNPNNTYIDIGSPLDPILFGKNTRGYLRIHNR